MSEDLGTSIKFILSSKYLNNNVALHFAIVRKLLFQEEDNKNDNFSRNLLWAQLVHQLVTLAKQDASEKLLDMSMNASRRTLIQLSEQKQNEKQKQEVFLGLNFLLRESISRRFPGIRICIQQQKQQQSNNNSNEEVASASAARFMIAAKNTIANEIICQEEPFACWEGGGVEESLIALKQQQSSSNKTNKQKLKVENKNKNNDTENEIDDPQNNITKNEKASGLWCPDLYLSEAMATFLARSPSIVVYSSSSSSAKEKKTVKGFLSRKECKTVAALRANCHSYDKPQKEEQEEEENKSSSKSEEQSNNDTDGNSNNNNNIIIKNNNKNSAIAVFDVLSKISHSCAPNCFYDGTGRLLANGEIEPGTVLGFSYFHRKFLLRGTEARRAILEDSHNFICGCSRCCSSSTKNNNPQHQQHHGRSFVCKNCSNGAVCEVFHINNNFQQKQQSSNTPCSSWFTVSSSSTNSSNSSKWMCVDCGDTASNTEISKFLATEYRLENSIATTLNNLTSASLTNIPKNIFEQVRSHLHDCLSVLGRKHWLYLETIRLAIQFFVRIGMNPKLSTRSTTFALETSIRWALKFISACKLQNIMVDAPSAAASYAFEPARTLLDRCPTSKFRIHAALILKMAIDVDESFAERNQQMTEDMLHVAERALDIYNNETDLMAATANSDVVVSSFSSSSQKKKNQQKTSSQQQQQLSNFSKTALEATCRAAEMDVDDSDLLQEWETHLANRVSEVMQRQGPLSQQLRAQFGFGKQ